MKAVVAVLAVVIAVTALAADVPEFLRSDAPQSPRLVTKLNEAGAVIDARFAAAEALQVVVTDTNVTTTTMVYTPAFKGQLMVGGKTGTNAVWVAKGVTTNDWVQVAP